MKQKRISVYAAILGTTLLASLLLGMGASAAVPSANENISEGEFIATSSEFVPESSIEEETAPPPSSHSQIESESLDTQSSSDENTSEEQPVASSGEPVSESSPEEDPAPPSSSLSPADPEGLDTLQPALSSESALHDDTQMAQENASSKPQSDTFASSEERETFAVGDLVEIDATTAEVFTYAALKIAAESSQYTTVLLGQDIQQTTATGNIPIVVNKTKSSFVLDGQGYTLTQISSAGIERTISVDASNTVTKNVIVRNMNIIGANYWGVVHIGSANVIYTLDEVSYNGPQPAYNPGGTARFINSTFELTDRGTASQEIAEAAHVELGGTVSIIKKTTLYSLFWLKGTSTSLTVLPNANVNINTEFYFIYMDGSPPNITIGENATLALITKQGFTWDAQSVNSLVLEENATLNITQNADRGFSGMYIRNLFHAKPGSNFHISRLAGTRAAIEMTLPNAQIVFDNPKHAAIYSSAGKAFQFSTNNALVIKAGSVNRWAQGSWPIPNDLANLPNHFWNKNNNKMLTLVVNITGTTINSFTHDLVAEDPTPVNQDLTIANFALFTTKIYTFGQMPLSVDTVYDSSNNVQGATMPSAVLRANYTTQAGTSAELTGAANTNGTYSLPIAETEHAKKDTTFAMVSFGNTLATRQNTVVQADDKGKLAFVTLPETLAFSNMPMPNDAALIGRQDSNWHISVQDTRPTRTPWRVDAAIQTPLTAIVNEQPHTLPNALVYVDEQNNRTPLNENLATVFSYDVGTPEELVNVEWSDKTGLMLWVPPGTAQSNVSYNTTIEWVLIDAP